MNCDRTSSNDVGGQIATALGYNLIFGCEFEEIYSPLRKPEDQGGGVSGSCILSKYEFEITRALIHKNQPVEWSLPGPIPHEPKRGLRITPFVTVKTPFGLVGCYCVHLEEYCGKLTRWFAAPLMLCPGIEARMEQFMEIMDDAAQLPAGMPIVIAGDFATKAHGVARLSPWYCGDWLRLGSLGSSEADVCHFIVLLSFSFFLCVC